MPSRWPSTGTRASSSTRFTSDLPPRGMIRSTVPPSRPATRRPRRDPRSARSGRNPPAGPASSSPAAIASPIARQEASASAPLRRISALPERRQIAAASAATLGRLSKIMPMTPIGVRTRAKSRPLGRVQRAISSPSGSGKAAICSTAAAIASRRASSRRRRSTRRVALATSPRLAARMGRAGADPAGDGADRRAPRLRGGAAQHAGGGARLAAHLLAIIARASRDRRGGSRRRGRHSRAIPRSGWWHGRRWRALRPNYRR